MQRRRNALVPFLCCAFGVDAAGIALLDHLLQYKNTFRAGEYVIVESALAPLRVGAKKTFSLMVDITIYLLLPAFMSFCKMLLPWSGP